MFTKNLPLFPILGQMRTFRAVPYYWFYIRFCIITSLQLGIQCVPFPSIFPTKAYMHFCDSSYLPHDPHILPDTSTFRGRASGTYTLPTEVTCVQCLGAQIGSYFFTAALQISYESFCAHTHTHTQYSMYNSWAIFSFDLVFLVWTNKRTLWGRILPGKLIVSQLVKTFRTFYGIVIFITAFTRAHQLSLFWARSLQSTFLQAALCALFTLSTTSYLKIRKCSAVWWWSFAALFVRQVMPRVAAASRDEGRACGPTDPGDCRSVLLGKCTFLVVILP